MIGKSEKKEFISLYFHIPFCSKKCPYCHFFVLPNKPELKEHFLKALHLEIPLVLNNLEGFQVVSIYFGGGTPFLIGPQAIEGILNHLKSLHLNILPNCEITLEMNPEDSNLDLLKAYRQIGVNRLSIGVQSLNDNELCTLGRTHNANQSLKAIESAHLAGFDNLSIDLMYDLPSQGEAQWKRTVDIAKNLPITHLSLYNLTIEPHTGFHKRRKELEKTLPSPEESLSFLNYAVQELEKTGLKRYEISAFAKEEFHSIHNTGYWLGREFIGLGPSAFSFRNKKRYRNVCNLNSYVDSVAQAKSPVDFEETLPYPHDLYELLAVRIRLLEGVYLKDFESTFGLLPNECHHTLEELQKEGFLTFKEDLVKLTDKGILFYDTVASEII